MALTIIQPKREAVADWWVFKEQRWTGSGFIERQQFTQHFTILTETVELQYNLIQERSGCCLVLRAYTPKIVFSKFQGNFFLWKLEICGWVDSWPLVLGTHQQLSDISYWRLCRDICTGFRILTTFWRIAPPGGHCTWMNSALRWVAPAVSDDSDAAFDFCTLCLIFSEERKLSHSYHQWTNNVPTTPSVGLPCVTVCGGASVEGHLWKCVSWAVIDNQFRHP